MSIAFDVITLFPEMFVAVADYGITRRARERGLWRLSLRNPRDFAVDNYRTVDDRPYGGGPGMVMLAEPLEKAIGAARANQPGAKVICLSPQGRPLSHERVLELAQEAGAILLCGRYEGIDERVTHVVTDRVSIGPYVLSGGEVAAMALLDAVTRKLPGVISNPASVVSESHAAELGGGAEYPHYTRPAEFRGWEVPEVLRSGHHAEIERWRREQVERR